MRLTSDKGTVTAFHRRIVRGAIRRAIYIKNIHLTCALNTRRDARVLFRLERECHGFPLRTGQYIHLCFTEYLQ